MFQPSMLRARPNEEITEGLVRVQVMGRYPGCVFLGQFRQQLRNGESHRSTFRYPQLSHRAMSGCWLAIGPGAGFFCNLSPLAHGVT